MCVVMRIIIVLFVISFVDFVMIFLVIIFVISMVIRFVWMVGWGRSVRKLCVNKGVICFMGDVLCLGSVGVVMVGKGGFVMSVFYILVVCMVVVWSFGSVIVRLIGVVCFVIKI